MSTFADKNSRPDEADALVRLTHEEMAALVEELEDSPFLRLIVRRSVLPKCLAALALNPWAGPGAS